MVVTQYPFQLPLVLFKDPNMAKFSRTRQIFRLAWLFSVELMHPFLYGTVQLPLGIQWKNLHASIHQNPSGLVVHITQVGDVPDEVFL